VVEKIHKYLNKRKMLQIISRTVFTEETTTEGSTQENNQTYDYEEVIKTEYGIICNQDTGVGCSEGTGEYNDNPLKTGEAITNPGLLEK
jgi:hypothetical protein